VVTTLHYTTLDWTGLDWTASIIVRISLIGDTEQVGSSGNTFNLYLEDTKFES
jgi:hypothetical protein